MEGWIKLHRKIQEHYFWTEKRRFSKFEAWIDILFKANHKDTEIMINWKKVKIEKGSFITSEVKLAEKWKWARSTVRRFLDLLQEEKMIQKNATSDYTTITVVNWDLYQNREQPTQHQENSERTSGEQQKDTNKNDKNIKNDKNEKNISKDKEVYIATPKKKQEEKIHFAEFVTMTNAEYDKLVSTYGKEFADQCITVLDNYKGSKGKAYKSDYRAILSWVVDNVKQKQTKTSAIEEWLNG